jgi:membrane protein DedA with SNARE-associated domain
MPVGRSSGARPVTSSPAMRTVPVLFIVLFFGFAIGIYIGYILGRFTASPERQRRWRWR